MMPISIGLPGRVQGLGMASWEVPAVAAPGTASYATPLMDFIAIANLPKDYYAGKEMAYKSRELQRQDDQATAFRCGIPRVDPNSSNSLLDYGAMSDRMLQLGNYPQADTFLKTDIEMQ